MRRLHAAGYVRTPVEAMGLMFQIMRRLKRDIALAGHIRAMLGTRPGGASRGAQKNPLIPAKAGTQGGAQGRMDLLDPRLRGDERNKT